jgi:hypothetical protein
MKRRLVSMLMLLAGTMACRLGSVGVVLPTATPLPPTPALPTATVFVPTPTATVEPPIVFEHRPETILILSPGPGSLVMSPLHVEGAADSTFEQALVLRLVLDDGTEIARQPVTIEAPLGTRGAFAADLPFVLTREQQGFLQVYSTSPRDGGTLHLASVGISLSRFGPPDIRSMEDGGEQLELLAPLAGDEIEDGVVHVRGFGLAGFEQTLLVEIYDGQGSLVGSSPVIVDAPDLGQPGGFIVDVPYAVNEAGPGRVVVRDVSPAFGGDVHLASVEVDLRP